MGGGGGSQKSGFQGCGGSQERGVSREASGPSSGYMSVSLMEQLAKGTSDLTSTDLSAPFTLSLFPAVPNFKRIKGFWLTLGVRE